MCASIDIIDVHATREAGLAFSNENLMYASRASIQVARRQPFVVCTHYIHKSTKAGFPFNHFCLHFTVG